MVAAAARNGAAAAPVPELRAVPAVLMYVTYVTLATDRRLPYNSNQFSLVSTYPRHALPRRPDAPPPSNRALALRADAAAQPRRPRAPAHAGARHHRSQAVPQPVSPAHSRARERDSAVAADVAPDDADGLRRDAAVATGAARPGLRLLRALVLGLGDDARSRRSATRSDRVRPTRQPGPRMSRV